MKNKTIEQKAEEFSKSNSIYPSAEDDTYFGFLEGFRQNKKETDKIVLDTLNLYRSRLSDVQRVKLTKIIDEDKIKLLEGQILVLIELQNKLK